MRQVTGTCPTMGTTRRQARAEAAVNAELVFLTLTEPFQERELETELVRHLEKFLVELGQGFAFVSRQYRLDEERGQKKGRTWRLSAATYRLLDRLAQRGLVERESFDGVRVPVKEADRRPGPYPYYGPS